MKHTLLIVFAYLFTPCTVHTAQGVIRHPRFEEPLEQRWQWALNEGARQQASKGYCIVYSIQKLMNENSYMSSGNFFSGSVNTSTSLYEIIDQQRNDTSIATAAQKALARIKGKGRSDIKVMKDLAIIVEFPPHQIDPAQIRDVSVCNMELEFEFDGRTILWLGPAEDSQSSDLLRELFESVRNKDAQENLVTAIGTHQPSSKSFAFLSGVLQGKYPSDVREQAAFWLGEQNNPDAIKLLMTTAQSDNSEDLREKAVFAISQMESPEALESLIMLARSAKNSEIRGKAVFWLGQTASRKAISTVEEIASDDADVEVQKQALFSLAQMENDEGVSFLIKIAKTHPKAVIRKHAIMCLGQSEDPRALDAIVEIARAR
jgi:hypothetical protein